MMTAVRRELAGFVLPFDFTPLFFFPPHIPDAAVSGIILSLLLWEASLIHLKLVRSFPSPLFMIARPGVRSLSLQISSLSLS